MQRRFCYLNGEIVETDQARISPYDIGLLRGYAVFDLLRTVAGRPFLLAEHLKRLRASAAELGLAVPASDAEIADAIDRLLELNEHTEATVRLVLTGGISADGMHATPGEETFLILTHDLPVLPTSTYERGARLVTHEHLRECPTAKTTNYLTLLKHHDVMADAGAIDLLYHDGERVTEAATASFFVVRDGRVLAPEADVLPGTVGQLVLEAAGGEFEVSYGDVTVDDVLGAAEAFLTSTTRGVVPIVEIDGRAIGDGRVGPVTRAVMERFDAAVASAAAATSAL